VIPVLFEDEAIVAVDKPAGALVIRGREGAREPSLVDRLIRLRGERLYVVHRLDRGTSGVLLLARSAAAHRSLSMAFEAGKVEKRYFALVSGVPPEDRFTVDLRLAPARRGKMKPAPPGAPGKTARTGFRVLERFSGFAFLDCTPEGGRTHQIRVHLKSAGFPLAVDPLYGGRRRLLRGDLGCTPGDVPVLERTSLHAAAVILAHPAAGERITIEAPLPQDMEKALALLRSSPVPVD
jgi:tRNA pseudouridine32 synthase/23S rRNA pseudouridine746 synthase